MRTKRWFLRGIAYVEKLFKREKVFATKDEFVNPADYPRYLTNLKSWRGKIKTPQVQQYSWGNFVARLVLDNVSPR